MTSDDDPEARIRELEQPLADTARASEAVGNQPPSKWAAPSGPVAPPPPPPYSGGGPALAPPPPPLPYTGSMFGQAPQPSSNNRVWWIVAAVFVIGMIALPVAILFFTAHQVSHSGLTTLFPTPSFVPDRPSPSIAVTPTAPAAAPSVPPSGETLSISGINENRTIACNQNTVSISGVGNTVVITGHCTSLSVSGVQNKITVEAVDSIEASGFSNQITYRKGSPHIEQSGEGNVVHQG
ncbi:DUF3060 domain-containing protein [Mycobacterium cookii]|nr:DUF3060 domain-containing protein [Mycobacterium cookii]MCV7331338.1 DUF3060 domain-containing protein [Mycobacterium cookii]